MSEDAQKTSIRRRRDSAFTAKLDIDSDDKIWEILSVNNRLYAVTLKRIFQISTPDEIDPQMESVNAPLTQSIVVENGSRNPIVARTVLQTKDALPFIASPNEQPQIVGISWEVMLRMLEFESIITSIEKDIQQAASAIEVRLEEYPLGSWNIRRLIWADRKN